MGGREDLNDLRTDIFSSRLDEHLNSSTSRLSLPRESALLRIAESCVNSATGTCLVNVNKTPQLDGFIAITRVDRRIPLGRSRLALVPIEDGLVEECSTSEATSRHAAQTCAICLFIPLRIDYRDLSIDYLLCLESGQEIGLRRKLAHFEPRPLVSVTSNGERLIHLSAGSRLRRNIVCRR